MLIKRKVQYAIEGSHVKTEAQVESQLEKWFSSLWFKMRFRRVGRIYYYPLRFAGFGQMEARASVVPTLFGNIYLKFKGDLSE